MKPTVFEMIKLLRVPVTIEIRVKNHTEITFNSKDYKNVSKLLLDRKIQNWFTMYNGTVVFDLNTR
jgi:hypothetical protein